MDNKRLESIIKTVNEDSIYFKENKKKFTPDERKYVHDLMTDAKEKIKTLSEYRLFNDKEKEAVSILSKLKFKSRKRRSVKSRKSVKRRSVKPRKSRKRRSVKPRKSVKRRSVKPKKSENQ